MIAQGFALSAQLERVEIEQESLKQMQAEIAELRGFIDAAIEDTAYYERKYKGLKAATRAYRRAEWAHERTQDEATQRAVNATRERLDAMLKEFDL